MNSWLKLCNWLFALIGFACFVVLAIDENLEPPQVRAEILAKNRRFDVACVMLCVSGSICFALEIHAKEIARRASRPHSPAGELERRLGGSIAVIAGLSVATISIWALSKLYSPSRASGSTTTGTDGIFESATRKMDKGKPLNKEEIQRVDDLVNWCKICKKPLRQCPHGK